MSESGDKEEIAFRTVAEIERLANDQAALNSGHARRALRKFLFERAGVNSGQGSIGDALSLLAEKTPQDSLSAIVALRALDVEGLMPSVNEANQIPRSVVRICEGSLTDLVTFLRIERRGQTYQRFAELTRCHKRVCELLAPLTAAYGDLEALIHARKEILGCLRHSIVQLYAGPFGLKELRKTVEAISGRLKRVAAMDATLLTDVEDSLRSIAAARDEARSHASFLNRDFLLPFLNTCERIVSEFLTSQRARFTTSIEWAGGSSSELQKKYPLHEPGREIQIVIPLRVSGPGMATGVQVTAALSGEEMFLETSTISLGNVLPGAFSVILDVMTISPCLDFAGILNVEWGEIGYPANNSEIFEFRVSAQSGAIDWSRLEFTTPYSTEVAEGDQFIGREEKVKNLAAKLLRRPMEPFYITGQKRVGKTSLALAAANFAKAKSIPGTLEYMNILWGDIADADPTISMRRLGEQIESFIFKGLPSELRFERGDYTGSLAPLVTLADTAIRTEPHRAFVIILDEFDEIHPELFMQGNLADTLFANLRALSRRKNICIVLVGGENMPFIMERQGQKLNNFSRFNLSYFSRDAEWADFQQMIKTPTSGILNWHDDSISEVFNVTNGNPYFAKLVCSSVFRAAVSNRDADITSRETKFATESEVSGLGVNSFIHLWQDGIPKPPNEREPEILRRMRTLVAYARCSRRHQPPTAANVIASKASSALAESQIAAVLNDFVRREVLVEQDGRFELSLPIFKLWLVDVGVTQLIADSLNEELTDLIIAEENKATVRSNEIVDLAKKWPTYCGNHIGTDEIRAWIEQVEGQREQRILFKLLGRTRIYSEALVRERLKNAHSLLRNSFPVHAARKGRLRVDVLVTYVDGPGKSGASYANAYAEGNGIAAECVLAPSNFTRDFNEHAKRYGRAAAAIVIDDIAATGDSLSDNLVAFCEANRDILKSTKVRVVTLIATVAAQAKLNRVTTELNESGLDVEYRSCEMLGEESFAFPKGLKVWDNEDQAERAIALCKDLGSSIYRDQPLGFGGMGLLVVFPTTVPNNTLPILHSYSRAGSVKMWKPLFLRPVN